jgi:hypothetical protein
MSTNQQIAALATVLADLIRKNSAAIGTDWRDMFAECVKVMEAASKAESLK